MRSLSAVLLDLIGIAESIVVKSSTYDPRQAERFAAIAAEVRYADQRPAEAERVTQAALVMVIAIEKFQSSDSGGISHWQMIAGATLPLLRGDAWLAIKQDRGQGA